MASLTKRRLGAFVLLCLAVPAQARSSNEVLVVLSSNLKPYQEALAGFRQEYGKDVPTMVMTESEISIPPDTNVVVAIGGKAALRHYPARVRLIYCLAPGLLVRAEGYLEKPVKIYTSPALFAVVAKFKEMSPGMKRLGIPWISESIHEYLMDKGKVASSLGIEVIATQLQTTDDLPDYLRGSKGKIDALWLPPDPPLITASSLAIIKEFSWASDIPFFVPTEGLVEQGATASVSSSFMEIGRTAARVAAAAVAKTRLSTTVYPVKLQVGINITAAKESNLTIPPEAVKAADRVFP